MLSGIFRLPGAFVCAPSRTSQNDVERRTPRRRVRDVATESAQCHCAAREVGESMLLCAGSLTMRQPYGVFLRIGAADIGIRIKHNDRSALRVLSNRDVRAYACML